MSSVIYTKYINLSVNSAIHYGVDKATVEKVSDYVRRIIRDKGLSYREIARIATQKGFKISHSAVSDVVNERYENITLPVLQAIAKGMGEPEETIFSLFRGHNADVGKISYERFSDFADRYSKLSDNQRLHIEPLLAAIDGALNAYENQLQAESDKQKKDSSHSAQKKSKDGPPEMTVKEFHKKRGNK